MKINPSNTPKLTTPQSFNLYGESAHYRQAMISLMESATGQRIIFEGDLPDTQEQWDFLALVGVAVAFAGIEIFSDEQINQLVNLISGEHPCPVCIISRANMVERYPKLASVMVAGALRDPQPDYGS